MASARSFHKFVLVAVWIGKTHAWPSMKTSSKDGDCGPVHSPLTWCTRVLLRWVSLFVLFLLVCWLVFFWLCVGFFLFPLVSGSLPLLVLFVFVVAVFCLVHLTADWPGAQARLVCCSSRAFFSLLRDPGVRDDVAFHPHCPPYLLFCLFLLAPSSRFWICLTFLRRPPLYCWWLLDDN